MDWQQIINVAQWALPFVVGYLVWVHRGLITLRADVDHLKQRVTEHDQVAQQLGDIKTMLARLEERIDAVLRDRGR